MNADPKAVASAPDAQSPGPSGDHRTESVAPSPARTGAHIWLVRTRALLFVTVCATFGVLLVILPWTPTWTDNPLLLSFPSLRDILASGFVRGLASGLGILDLWLGFWEAIHYHEPSAKDG